MNISPMNPLAWQLENAVRLLSRHMNTEAVDVMLNWSPHSARPVYAVGNRVMVFGPQSPQRPTELMCLIFNEYHKMVGGCRCAS